MKLWKAFNLNLSEALFHEFRRRRIDIMSCCAGMTDTPNFRNTKPIFGLFRPAISRPGQVAESALKHLGRRAVFIPGATNKITVFLLSRILPRKISTTIMNYVMTRIYPGRTGKVA